MSICFQECEYFQLLQDILNSENFCSVSASVHLGKTAKEHGICIVMIPICSLPASGYLLLKDSQLQA